MKEDKCTSGRRRTDVEDIGPVDDIRARMANRAHV